ncbi:hypothetical protein GQ44DRAFT_711077 [Phaeosphaeriaceae sp. PMI808]|nr:hypothetical protein GQ44DRAFT_711077 [Phaeosphaeriaceae sp. PMI808]
MAFSVGLPWNKGEETMHHLLRVPPQDNPTSAMLTPQAAFMLQNGPLLALGTLDSQYRPWTTLWGGTPGFSEPLGGGLVGTRAFVDLQHDPVVHALVPKAQQGNMLQSNNAGKVLAGLAIDLMTRKRVKIAGQMVAGGVQEVNVKYEEGHEDDVTPTKQSQIQLVTKIDQSLGNCPKYLNQYQLEAQRVESKLISDGAVLTERGRELIDKSDMFFLSTSAGEDMDVNHRGGPPGFVRILSSNEIVYPEYSGNRLYQSLGNLQLNPKIGITFPDYDTGDVLYITGTTDILVGVDAANLLQGSNLVVKITIGEARLVQRGLSFRGVRKEQSPYNPRVRALATEGNIKSTIPTLMVPILARLVKKVCLTPSITRFTFSTPTGIAYTAGQWVALSFKEELDIGYEHMRDDDPTSLNDDFVRTFTISSTPKSQDGKEQNFDMTVRRVGAVTKFLFEQNERVGLEVPILGVGGEFRVQLEEKAVTPFIAGGVGITPLLGQLHKLGVNPSCFQLLWTLKMADMALVHDVLQQHPELAKLTKVFFTSSSALRGVGTRIKDLESLGAQVNLRRIVREDMSVASAERWYLCSGKPLREQVLSWADGKQVVFENFDF